MNLLPQGVDIPCGYVTNIYVFMYWHPLRMNMLLVNRYRGK